MAHVYSKGRSVKCGVNWSIDGGIKPGATCTMIAPDGGKVELRLEPDEFAKLWGALGIDGRFKVDKRPPKADPNLAPDLEQIWNDLGMKFR